MVQRRLIDDKSMDQARFKDDKDHSEMVRKRFRSNKGTVQGWFRDG